MNENIPNILCVDDEPKNLRLLEFILQPRGYNVTTADNGRTALEKIRTERIDLVLLDVMMPEMDGFAVCKAIKDDAVLRHVPVIMITSLTAKKDRIRGIETGVDEFLSKPFNQGEVLARIKMLLSVMEMNDELNQAYDNITRLIDFGEKTIKAFDPLRFDFMAHIDNIVHQIIRSENDPIKKPRSVLVCIHQDKDGVKLHEWHCYESVFGAVERMRMEINMPFPLAGREEGIFFSNATGASATGDKDLHRIIRRLRDHKIQINNIVCNINPAISVFAINYGRDVSAYDAAVLNSIVMQTLYLKSLAGQVKDVDGAFEYTIHTLARASEVNDEDTGRHIIRVGRYCSLMAEKLNLPEDFRRAIAVQAALHDVGKIHIPASILKKPGALTDDEWRLIKKHPVLGAKIIGDHPRLKLAKTIALTHHERWDGRGYPGGLRGDKIPLAGRIMAVADQYDALRNARVYKPPYDHRTAFTILTKGDSRTPAGGFDPALLNLLMGLSAEFENVYNRLTDSTSTPKEVCHARRQAQQDVGRSL